eukprot:109330-Chlamydomonas_euryale.AAC.4
MFNQSIPREDLPLRGKGRGVSDAPPLLRNSASRARPFLRLVRGGRAAEDASACRRRGVGTSSTSSV